MRVELCPNIKKDPDLSRTLKVIDILFNCGAEIIVREDIPLSSDKVVFGSDKAADMLIVLGGDGSIMRAARRGAEKDIPVLGIDLGRVGYLAELAPDDELGLIDIINGNYYVEKRMMLESVAVINGTTQDRSYTAINDIVLSHGSLSHLLETEVFCDGSSIGRYRSDGFIVSTPIGSTAYSLSAGGPVLAPGLKGICLTPICPHSLTARPIIVPEDSDIEIRYLSPSDSTSHLTVDGVESAVLLPGDSLKIKRSVLTADFVRGKRDRVKNFYDVLREKMSDI